MLPSSIHADFSCTHLIIRPDPYPCNRIPVNLCPCITNILVHIPTGNIPIPYVYSITFRFSDRLIIAARAWNTLTPSVQSSESLTVFRRRLKTELFSYAPSQIHYISVCSIASWLSLQPWSRLDYNVVMTFRFNNNNNNVVRCRFRTFAFYNRWIGFAVSYLLGTGHLQAPQTARKSSAAGGIEETSVAISVTVLSPSTVSFLQLLSAREVADDGRWSLEDGRPADLPQLFLSAFPRARLAGVARWAEALLQRSRRPSVRPSVCLSLPLRVSLSPPLDTLLTRTCRTYVAAPTSGLGRRRAATLMNY